MQIGEAVTKSGVEVIWNVESAEQVEVAFPSSYMLRSVLPTCPTWIRLLGFGFVFLYHLVVRKQNPLHDEDSSCDVAIDMVCAATRSL